MSRIFRFDRAWMAQNHTMAKALCIPLPRGWPRSVVRGLLHAIGLERLALLDVRSGFDVSPDPRAGLVAELDRMRELVLLREEEIRIKDARWEAPPP